MMPIFKKLKFKKKTATEIQQCAMLISKRINLWINQYWKHVPCQSCMQAHEAECTLCLKKRCHFNFLNNRKTSILRIFGMQHHKKLNVNNKFCSPHLNTVSTQPCEMLKLSLVLGSCFWDMVYLRSVHIVVSIY